MWFVQKMAEINLLPVLLLKWPVLGTSFFSIYTMTLGNALPLLLLRARHQGLAKAIQAAKQDEDLVCP